MRNVRRVLVVFALVALTASSSFAVSILAFDDNTSNGRAISALDSLGLAYTQAGSGNFNTLLTGATWDLVVLDIPSNEPDGGYGDLISYIGGGGRAIMSFWWLQEYPGLAAAFGVTQVSSFSSPQDVYRWDAAHPIFTHPNAVGDLTSWTDNWADDGDKLALGADLSAFAVAGFTVAPAVGEGAIIVGNQGRTIYNGFLFDELDNAVPLIQNEILFALSPEPSSILLVCVGFGALGVAVRRRRRAAA